MRLLIAGGGGFRVPLIYRALVSGRYAGLVTELVLHDVDAGRLDAVTAVLHSMPGHTSALPIHATTDLRQALAGATMVFAAIRPGGTAGRVADEKVAQRLGLLGQETTGAGGISYALRTIPPMLDLARLMREYCPDAWLINFTNPAGIVTEALLPLLGPRVIGICDSAGGLVHRAARAAGVTLPEGSLDGVGYYGLNHLGWLYRLESGGRDVLRDLLSDGAALQSFEEGRLFPQEFLANLGLLPNEYLFYYYQAAAARQAMGAMSQTRGETIHGQQQELYPRLAAAGADAYRLWEEARRSREEGYLAEARGDGEQRNEEDLAGGGYERVALAAMRALSGNADGSPAGSPVGGAQLVLNTRNTLPAAGGKAAPPATTNPSVPQPAIPGLPADAVVEVPCTVTPAGAEPLPQQAPAEPQLGLLRRVKEVERLTVQAVREGNRDAALAAFARHPLVGSPDLAMQLLAGYEEAFPALGKIWQGGGR
ncbi:family 4 glycosyl hydrolase [Arthrobacter sp. MAHUQ-56]